ncbi:hypothetical protein FLL65_18280 [Vibrio cholerae]|nr:hypothetical protein FLL91_10555 [Vibrio cholerae]TQQ07613.1 hypothetical protein FLL72_06850 [Vibrio cholerae]TQQ43736.1 hypothetical protein FLL65_18280 [Vibrio cholerae]
MPICSQQHRHWPFLESLPNDQGGFGRHKCAGCAYERGYAAGKNREEVLNLDIDSLPESQAGSVRHKSPHAAFAQGYYDGVHAFYNNPE